MLLTRSLEDVAALPELPLGGSQTQLRNALRIQSRRSRPRGLSAYRGRPYDVSPRSTRRPISPSCPTKPQLAPVREARRAAATHPQVSGRRFGRLQMLLAGAPEQAGAARLPLVDEIVRTDGLEPAAPGRRRSATSFRILLHPCPLPSRPKHARSAKEDKEIGPHRRLRVRARSAAGDSERIDRSKCLQIDDITSRRALSPRLQKLACGFTTGVCNDQGGVDQDRPASAACDGGVRVQSSRPNSLVVCPPGWRIMVGVGLGPTTTPWSAYAPSGKSRHDATDLGEGGLERSRTRGQTSRALR